MRLNKGQQKTFTNLIKFINDPAQKYYTISGDAGTGKTFLIKYIFDELLNYVTNSKISLNSINVTATTNKAAAVISADNVPASTIYSYMNLRVKEDWNTGEVKCIPTPSWKIHSSSLIIIDEASMANEELLRYLEEGTDNSCKIIFIGDANQLAPVKEHLSQAFNQGYGSSLLTEKVRNANSQALMDLCEQAKQTVLTGKFTPITEVPGVIDFVGGGQILKGVLERNYSTENLDSRVLCYTNKQVTKYNNHIRKLRGYTEPYVKGEILTNNSAADVIGKGNLYTDQIVRIDEIYNRELKDDILSGYEFDITTMKISDINTGISHTVPCFTNQQEKHNLLKYFAQNKNWGKYFKLKKSYPELRSTAASTTHKAQGSTYESVVVDLEDIGKATNRSQIARMQYVALSRPKTRLYIRGQLPYRLFKDN